LHPRVAARQNQTIDLQTVYLDQNKWIDLARAYHGRPDGTRFRDALATCERASQAGTALFPLSTSHYEETALVTDSGRRDRLAEMMEALSGFTTIASQSHVVPVEIELALNRKFGRPAEPMQLGLYGFGAAHAFGDADLDYRPPPGLPLDIHEQFVAVAQAKGLHLVLERILLRGLGIDAAARSAARGVDEQFFNERATTQALLMTHGADSGEALRSGVFGMVLAEIWGPLTAALSRAELSLDEFFEGVDLREFVLDLPSRRVMAELQRAQHAGGAAFKRGDLKDLGFLAVAVAYCDVVATENQWTHILRQSKLDEVFGTIIVDDVGDLPKVLAIAST
jgi:hypothetical protein